MAEDKPSPRNIPVRHPTKDAACKAAAKVIDAINASRVKRP